MTPKIILYIGTATMFAMLLMAGCSGEQADQNDDRSNVKALNQDQLKTDTTGRPQQSNRTSLSTKPQAESTPGTNVPPESGSNLPTDETWDFLVQTRQRYDEFNHSNDKGKNK